EPGGDVLSRPAQCARVVDLEDLQPFGEGPQGGDRSQPDVRVVVGRALGDFECALHVRQHMLTIELASTYADAEGCARAAGRLVLDGDAAEDGEHAGLGG